MSGDYKFEGWLGHDAKAIGNMKWGSYEPKPWSENDIDIKITHSGICGSDLHYLRSGWQESIYPCVVGHEIVGTAVKVGSKAEGGIKVGDRVGVGAQSNSCLKGDCEDCSEGHENHCTIERTDTFGDKFPDGSVSYGGYANYIRCPSHFVFKIPDAVSSEAAAPMLCGGITVYNPLVTHGAGPGKKVGIVGIGGLGHFGILWAKALGCEKITAISRGTAKKADAMKMGATDYIATDEEKDWAKNHAKSLDLIVCTVFNPKLPLSDFLTLLKRGGTFVQVGAPEDNLPGFNAFELIFGEKSLSGSCVGPPKMIREMLQFAADKDVQAWIEVRKLSEANQCVLDMDKGLAKYRYTMVNDMHKS